MNNGFSVQIYLDCEIRLANLYLATQKRFITKRK